MAINQNFGAALEWWLRDQNKWKDDPVVTIAETFNGSGEYEIKEWDVQGINVPPDEATILQAIADFAATGDPRPDGADKKARKQAIKQKLNLTDKEVLDLRELLADGDDQ